MRHVARFATNRFDELSPVPPLTSPLRSSLFLFRARACSRIAVKPTAGGFEELRSSRKRRERRAAASPRVKGNGRANSSPGEIRRDLRYVVSRRVDPGRNARDVGLILNLFLPRERRAPIIAAYITAIINAGRASPSRNAPGWCLVTEIARDVQAY